MRLKQHKWKKWFKDFALNKLRTLHTQFDFSSNVPFMRWMPDQQTVNSEQNEQDVYQNIV